jgi:serine/threonine-protein kinase RsbW
MSDKMKKTVTFPATYESLAAISKFVIAAAEAAGLDDKATYGLQLAVDEACSNIIKYAYEDLEAQGITCTCRVSDRSITITLRDEGRPFNPEDAPEPDICSPLKERQVGGLGLYFIRELMDEVRFSCAPDGSNVLTLVKHRR